MRVAQLFLPGNFDCFERYFAFTKTARMNDLLLKFGRICGKYEDFLEEFTSNVCLDANCKLARKSVFKKNNQLNTKNAKL